MNAISEQILQAAEIIANEKIEKLQFDKTVQAKVYGVVNLDTGEYKVRYNGNIFSAYSNDLKQTYKTNDWVYVNVPEGDFSGKKFIVSLVSGQSLTQSQLTSLKNSIFEISPDFSQLYGGLYDTSKKHGVIAGAPRSSDDSHDYIYQGPNTFQSNGFHGLFQQYANKYELIRIQASFSTQFYALHSKGNYGIEVEFYAKGNDIVSYKLDLNAFNGDPYRLSVASPQSIIVKIQKGYLLGLKSIKLFEEDFEYDRLVKNGQVTNELNTTEPNIFVQDISLQYVDIKDLSDTNYYLMIAAPRGIAFTSTVSSLDLQGRLVYMGKDIMDDKCKCQWYKRDLNIMIGEEDYDKEVGFGWRAIPGETSKVLSLNTSDVIHSQKYKLKVYYGEEPIVLLAEIEIFNNNNSYDYFIEQLTNGDNISLRLNNRLDDGDLIGDWFLSYPDGSYNSVNDGKKKNIVPVSNYLKYSSVTFYCQVYDHSGANIIGTIEHTIVNSESDEDVIISYIGEDMFRYDANGDIAIEDSEKERTLQVVLTWKEGFGAGYNVEWLMRDKNGKEVPVPTEKDNNNGPPQSMIEELWVDNYNILHYNIKQKYKVNYNNNTLIVKIKTITDQEYLFNKEILFLKDGDQGTNGTTYVVAVRPWDTSTRLKLSGFNPLVYNNGWLSTLPLRCYVYKDGELINENPKYDISYRWEGINIYFTEHVNDTIDNIHMVVGNFDNVIANGMGTISSSSNSASLQFYVKVQATINDKMNGRKTEVYASYPIDIIVGSLDDSLVDIDTIPSYIKYTASGTTPKFYNNDINFLYNKEKKNDSIIPMNKNVLDIEVLRGLYYLKPATNFIFENIKSNNESNIGVLKCEVSTDQFIIHPIIMYLDTYGNEAINGWDGTALDTGDGRYVFAPQVGAGVKDSYNRFTGVVMGKDSGQDKIGLYGYQAGLNVFGIMENGKAYFGAKAGGGQIVLDGRYATIFGGNVTLNETSGRINPAANGMYIRLADLNPDGETKAIGIGYSAHEDEIGSSKTEENFYVTYSGHLRATGVNIQGDIYANRGQIGGTARHGGWTIETNKLYSGSGTRHVELNSDQTTEYAMWAGGESAETSKFYVKRDGYLYATNAYIKGDITANTLTSNKGTIGGWRITSRGLFYGGNASDDDNDYENNATFKLSTSGKGSLYIGDSKDSGDNNSSYLRYSAGNLTVSGSIRANSLHLKQSGSYVNALDSENNIKGSIINCKGLNVTGENGSYFIVENNGNVKIKGTIVLDSNSKITWNQISDGDRILSDVYDSIDDVDYELSANIGYVEDFIEQFGYTTITGTGISTPTINAGWINAGMITADRIDTNQIMTIGGGSISVQGAYSAPTAIQIQGESVRILGDIGKIYLESGDGIHLEIGGGEVSIAGDLKIHGDLIVEGTIQGSISEASEFDMEDEYNDQ